MFRSWRTLFQKTIVYHVCESQDVSRYLDAGMSRNEGRHYVFEEWTHTQRYLSSLLPESSSPHDIKKYAVLVLSVDQDMLLPGPITLRKNTFGLDEMLNIIGIEV